MFLHSCVIDARLALRVFSQSPGFACGVVLVAGLGIAVNGAVFAALNALFIRPLPVPRAHEIVRVYTSESGHAGRYGASSYPDYVDLSQVPALRLAAYVPLATTVNTGAARVRAEGRVVSNNFFDALELGASLGRVFSASDAVVGDVPVVLAHAFWQREFGGNPAIVGEGIAVNGVNMTVVGVLPRAFGIEPAQVDLYIPVGAYRLMAPGSEFVQDRGARFVHLIGRLASGIGDARAASDLNLVMDRLAQAYPATNGGRIVSVTSKSALVDTVAASVQLVPVVPVMFAVSGILLLIAVTNVAGLLLARTLARRQELAVRLSLGASRLRILRQLVIESLVLGLAAEAAALGVLATLPVIARGLALPDAVQFGIDGRVLAFASLLTFATALAFSIGPGLRGAASHPHEALRHNLTTMPLARARGQRVMVVVQVALAITLVSTTALLGQSIRRQFVADPGFETVNVLAAEFEFARGSSTPDEDAAFAREALDHARRLPGVLSAAITASPPLASEGARMTIHIPAWATPSDGNLEVPFSNAGPDYCATLGLHILDGDELRSSGRAAQPRRAVLVNETMARRYWPGRSPVGSVITLGGTGGTAVPVIGVVGDARMVALSRPAGPHFYVQSDEGVGSTILIRAATAAGPLKPLVLQVFSRGVGDFILRRLRSMDEVMSASLAEAKAFAAVTAGISMLALLLAISALYALLSYFVVQRRREFGIRLALGATGVDVVRLVLSSGIRLTAAGAGIGLVTTFAAITAVQTLVGGVPAADLVLMLGVAAVACVVAVCACAIPAVRASSAHPAVTLRSD